MVAEPAAAQRLLILNPKAGSLKPELLQLLRDSLSDYEVVELKPGQDLADAYGSCPTSEEAVVVVVGGDGTIEAVVPCLAGSRRALGIIPLGTFNNFARALDLPLEIGEAIEVVKTGRRRPVTLGRADGAPFLETAAIGLFGDAIALGEAAKDRHFGELGDRLRRVANSEPFRYRLSGDVSMRGRAFSILFANTPSVGARLEIADTTPREPYLELQVRPTSSRRDLVVKLLRSLLRRRGGHDGTYPVRRVRVETSPPMPFYTDAREAGMTPVTIEAEPGGLWVILPDSAEMAAGGKPGA
jgi:diacylglycerol kinase family enzyme